VIFPAFFCDTPVTNHEHILGMTRRILLLVLVLSAALGAAAYGASNQGSITYLEGSVSIDNASASIGDVVPLGATLRTGPASQCEVVFRDRNIIRLGESTTLVFNPGNLQVGSTLEKGSLALVLKNLVNGESGEHNFFVRTPSTAAGVRGTLFFIKVEDSATTYVCTCNGVVTLDNGSQVGAFDVSAAHHTAWRLSNASGSPTAVSAPLLYHTDADMESLAKKVGVTIDWSTVQK
jgi:hypothetical protein